MRISIIPADKKIIVDGKTVDLEDDAPWGFDDETIHAIQWRDGRGELEYEDIPGEEPEPNKVFGDDEFDAIIQPYLDYFNSFLTLYEQKELATALAEEENLAAQIEDLNLDKLEKEAQLVIIEDLQKQNKELREEREELYDAQSKAEQARVYDNQTALIELEREKAAREAEKAALEAQKADEFFEKKSLELAKKYDELFHDFEKEKEAFIEERKQYQELLQMERDKMERETELLEQNILEDQKEKELRRLQEEKVRALEEEELEIAKIELEMQKQGLEVAWGDAQFALDEVNRERERAKLDHEQEQLKYQQRIDQEMDVIMRSHEEVLKKMDNEQTYDELDDALEREFEKAELEYREAQRAKLIEAQKAENIDPKGLSKLASESLERQELESGQEYSVNDILTLMDEIDPEKLYTTLTDEERGDGTEMPLDKAVKWFAALKEVLDKNDK